MPKSQKYFNDSRILHFSRILQKMADISEFYQEAHFHQSFSSSERVTEEVITVGFRRCNMFYRIKPMCRTKLPEFLIFHSPNTTCISIWGQWGWYWDGTGSSDYTPTYQYLFYNHPGSGCNGCLSQPGSPSWCDASRTVVPPSWPENLLSIIIKKNRKLSFTYNPI